MPKSPPAYEVIDGDIDIDPALIPLAATAAAVAASISNTEQTSTTKHNRNEDEESLTAPCTPPNQLRSGSAYLQARHRDDDDADSVLGAVSPTENEVEVEDPARGLLRSIIGAVSSDDNDDKSGERSPVRRPRIGAEKGIRARKTLRESLATEDGDEDWDVGGSTAGPSPTYVDTGAFVGMLRKTNADPAMDNNTTTEDDDATEKAPSTPIITYDDDNYDDLPPLEPIFPPPLPSRTPPPTHGTTPFTRLPPSSQHALIHTLQSTYDTYTHLYRHLDRKIYTAPGWEPGTPLPAMIELRVKLVNAMHKVLRETLRDMVARAERLTAEEGGAADVDTAAWRSRQDTLHSPTTVPIVPSLLPLARRLLAAHASLEKAKDALRPFVIQDVLHSSVNVGEDILPHVALARTDDWATLALVHGLCEMVPGEGNAVEKGWSGLERWLRGEGEGQVDRDVERMGEGQVERMRRARVERLTSKTYTETKDAAEDDGAGMQRVKSFDVKFEEMRERALERLRLEEIARRISKE